MSPHNLSPLPSPALDPEEVRLRKMNRRAKVIQELVQTEKDFLTDLELCIREVVQPLRNLQVDAFQHSEMSKSLLQAECGINPNQIQVSDQNVLDWGTAILRS